MPTNGLDLEGLRELAKARRKSVKETAQTAGAASIALAEVKRRGVISALRARLPDLPPDVEKHIEALSAQDIAAKKVEEIAKRAVHAVVSDANERQRLAAALTGADFVREARPPVETSPDIALEKVPGLAAEFERATVAEITRVAGLSDVRSESVLERVEALGAFSDQRIATLAIERKLTKKQATRLGVIAGLSQLLGGDTEMVERLSKATFQELGGKVVELTDLLKVNEAALAKVLDPQLAGSDPDAAQAAASALTIRVAQRFPVAGLTARLALRDPDKLSDTIKSVRKVLAKFPDALAAKPGTLKLSAADAQALRSLQATVLSYPGMGLDKLLAAGTPASAATKIKETVEVYERFVAQNADHDLLHFDPTPGSADLAKFDFTGIRQSARDGIIATAKARARVYAVAGEVEGATALMKGGFHSAMAIAKSNPAEIARWTGLSIEKAGIVFASAKDVRVSITNLVGTLVDELQWSGPAPNSNGVRSSGASDGLNEWKVPGLVWGGGQSGDITDGLKKLGGYEDLFGKQSFCDCKHCDSILSPSAYFVDLMTFVHDKVTSEVFKGTKARHALKLEKRRPDLWNVPLTCSDTYDLVPTLEIINEVLENAVATQDDVQFPVGNSAAVRAKVYGNVLPDAIESFVTPFDLRVATADRYLKDKNFQTDRGEILRLLRLDAGDEANNSASLALSLKSYGMITTQRAQWTKLEAIYRMTFPHAGATVNPFDVQEIISGTQIPRPDFGDLITTDYVNDGNTVKISIVPDKRDIVESVQNDIEKVNGATKVALDRAHRFWRLKRALDWPVRTLDNAIRRVGGELSDAAIAKLIIVRDAAKRFGLEIDEALALIGPIPYSLIDSLFNGSRAPDGADDFPNQTLRFVHPGLRDDASLPETGPNAPHFISQRIRLGLDLTEAELLDLILAFAGPLDIQIGKMPANRKALMALPESDRGFPLTMGNLAILYRHALLAAKLKLGFEELSLAIQIATSKTTSAIKTEKHLAQLLEYIDLTLSLQINTAKAASLMDLAPDWLAEKERFDPAAVAEAVLLDIETTEAMHFAPTVFALVEGVSETQSREIVDANAALFQKLDRDMLQLEPAHGLTPTLSPPSAGFPSGVASADLQAALAPFNLRRLIPERLAKALVIPADKLDALAKFAAVDLETQSVILGVAAGNKGKLKDAIAPLAKPLAALSQEAVTADRVAFIDSNRALFAINRPTDAFSCEAVIAIGAYCEALGSNIDVEGYADALEAALLSYTYSTDFGLADPTQLVQLAEAVGADVATVRVLIAGATLPGGAMLALHRLRRIASFAQDRRIDADALVLLASTDPSALGQGAESLKAALRLKLNNEEAFNTRVTEHEDALRGMRRDALVDYLVRNSDGRFSDAGDLYNYYLIDPEMEGCARTSRVVSAIGSLQTYVHRVLLNLEQDRLDAGAANHVHVSPTLIPRDEWQFRKNYRFWEAKRRVFLFPESYMYPELRDNKTPLFEEFEKTLLQQDITEQTVLDAYAAYLKGFEEVASLRIAGAYHEHVWSNSTDVLHVFGCTADDPPVYYYWTIENLTFSKLRDDRRISYSDRRKIDLAIPARDVSPIIFNNRLHLFWLEKNTAPWNEINAGSSDFNGYRHTLRVKYIALRLDGTWTPPQTLKLTESGYLNEGGILIDSLSNRKIGQPPFEQEVKAPLWADNLVSHHSYREGYELTAPAWQRIYPIVDH